jgi:hypothetical protein
MPGLGQGSIGFFVWITLHLPATLSLARRAGTKVIQHNPAKRESKHFVKLAMENHFISLSSTF